MKATFLRGFVALFFAFTMPCAGFAQQPSLQVQIQSAGEKVHAYELELVDWRQQARLALWLLIVVVACGATAAVLQSQQKGWARFLTVIAGATVSAATIVGTAAIDGDYKTLRRKARDGEIYIRSAQRWLDKINGATSDDLKRDYLHEIAPTLLSFEKLHARNDLGFEPVVFAEEGVRCGCVTKPLDDKSSLYKCGSGEAPSVGVARDRAVRDAIDNIISEIHRQPGPAQPNLSHESLANYIREISTRVDSCSSEGGGVSTYFVVLKVPRGLIDTKAQIAFGSMASESGKSATPIPNAAGQLPVTTASLLRKSSVDIAIEARPSKYGNFVFTFTVSAESRTLTLSHIQVNEDGTHGKTRWRFLVFVDGTVVSEIEAADYSDDGDKASIQVDPTSAVRIPIKGVGMHITIQGFRA